MNKLGFFIAAVGLAAGGSVPAAPAADAQRPNLVFIFSDDHAYQAISAYNDPRKLLDTPNLDRIVRKACGSTAVWSPIRSADPAGPWC